MGIRGYAFLCFCLFINSMIIVLLIFGHLCCFGDCATITGEVDRCLWAHCWGIVRPEGKKGKGAHYYND